LPNKIKYINAKNMKYSLPLFLVFLYCTTLSAQKIEIFSGPTHNRFAVLKRISGHFSSSSKSGIGFVAGIALDSVVDNKLRWRFTLQFEQYEGKLYLSNGGQAGYWSVDAYAKRSILSVGLFPYSFEIKNKIHLNGGAIISYVMKEKLTGVNTLYLIGNASTYNLQDSVQNYSKKLLIGAQVRAAYDIKISNTLILSPQYLFYIGLNREFKSGLDDAVTMRHYFCVGVKYGI
jgi:hypothetical protein